MVALPFLFFYKRLYGPLANSRKTVLRTLHANILSQFKSRSGLATIKALAIEPGRFRLWAEKTKKLVNSDAITSHIQRRFSRMTRLLQHLLTLSILGVEGFEMMHGVLSVGDLFALHRGAKAANGTV